MPTRFVILHHTTGSGEHWDLLLEHGDVLLAWQLLSEPAGPASPPIPARRIADHRKLYLDYEGPISGDRGHVTRIDAGMVEIEKFTGEECVVTLHGKRLSGRFALLRDGDVWSLDAAGRGA